MGVHDVREGMKISIAFENAGNRKNEYIGEVVDRKDQEVFVTVDGQGQEIIDKKDKHTVCQLRIVVDNVLYSWDDVEIILAKSGEKGQYKLNIGSNPKVFNRRKYPRMPLANTCTIKVKDSRNAYSGKMVNISANGFAFAVRDDFFANNKGIDVTVDINNFNVLEGKPLSGCVIRSSNNEGEYIVGCRMPEDSKIIKKYVSENYGE